MYLDIADSTKSLGVMNQIQNEYFMKKGLGIQLLSIFHLFFFCSNFIVRKNSGRKERNLLSSGNCVHDLNSGNACLYHFFWTHISEISKYALGRIGGPLSLGFPDLLW